MFNMLKFICFIVLSLCLMSGSLYLFYLADKDKKKTEEEINRHFQQREKEFERQRRLRYEAELVEIIRKRLMNFIFDESTFKEKIESLLDQISKKQVDPYTAAEDILGKILK